MNKALVLAFRRANLECIQSTTNKHGTVMVCFDRFKMTVNFCFSYTLWRIPLAHFKYDIHMLPDIELNFQLIVIPTLGCFSIDLGKAT